MRAGFKTVMRTSVQLHQLEKSHTQMMLFCKNSTRDKADKSIARKSKNKTSEDVLCKSRLLPNFVRDPISAREKTAG
jgi:hypothetical protein